MKDWMSALTTHYHNLRHQFPADNLILLFDIDGTILDMRYLVLHLLNHYDQAHRTAFFQTLTLEDIVVHENDITPLLSQLDINPEQQQEILAWYDSQAWSAAAILEAHRPFAGVLEVIRWFQMQPNTFIGLNTARPEFIRMNTLRSLNALGQEYKVQFDNELLYMRANNTADPLRSKVLGITYFQRLGYRVAVFIDNEPINLNAVAKYDSPGQILLLHADTISQSQRTRLPARAISGQDYKLQSLVSLNALPQHIQFVWQDISQVLNLSEFLSSRVHWGEINVSFDNDKLDFSKEPGKLLDVSNMTLEFTISQLLHWLHQSGKGLKINLRADMAIINKVLILVSLFKFDDQDLWFQGDVERLQEKGFKQLAKAFPAATLQCPIDGLLPLIFSDPGQARETLKMYRAWGINRFALGWHTANLPQVMDQMDRWGYPVDIYDVPDLEAFFKVVLLRPCSITCSFNFPEWYISQESYPSGSYPADLTYSTMPA